MMLLIQLRWIAVIGQIVTIAVTELALGISLPLGAMAFVVAGLVALNGLSYLWVRNRPTLTNRALMLALMLDVVALTAQLYLSGGATNPFTALYLMQVTLAAVLLEVAFAWTIGAIAAAGFLLLIVFNQPLMLPPGGRLDLFTLHIIGTFVSFVLNAALLVFFLVRITRNLRTRDARLAALKQQAAEEDLIVRMGLLASGAAHELGTPLASVAVILGDWRRMPEIRRNAELMEDIDEMQAAIERCKSIVTGILKSAGEARGDAPVITPVNDFLADLVKEWREASPGATLHYENAVGTNVPIISDSTLKQVVFNLLDNAFEASPHWIQLTAREDADALLLEVRDAGPGFAPDVLDHLGTPYHSTKSRGGGLGLFLVVNVVRKLGGSVSAGNHPEGGAVVTLRLPLETLTIGTRAHVG
ncbi:MAG: HAMP domain-containing histidine kinase [Steroidobacteraceae bacterium]|nr:HAMP domain-containing histidine kinase [Steroidobacteraceae bacterium]